MTLPHSDLYVALAAVLASAPTLAIGQTATPPAPANQ